MSVQPEPEEHYYSHCRIKAVDIQPGARATFNNCIIGGDLKDLKDCIFKNCGFAGISPFPGVYEIPRSQPGNWEQTPRWQFWKKPWRRRSWVNDSFLTGQQVGEWEYCDHWDFLLK